ncbi:hypothetical protein [Microbacterium sp. PMB16]|uniref:hypothetical protein n=1 Tax=Microbacterium sp. PMB16 TaxID=3120157 RepID=UPI003F4C65AF
MKRQIAVTLSTLSLAAGAALLGAVPAQAADGCDAGAVCYVLDGTIRAEVAPRVNPGVQFDQIINNSSSDVRVNWYGWGESNMFEGYIEGKAGSDLVRAGSQIDLGSTTASGVSSIQIVR